MELNKKRIVKMIGITICINKKKLKKLRFTYFNMELVDSYLFQTTVQYSTYCGGLQALALTLDPLPHVTLHGDQSPHANETPFTFSNIKKIYPYLSICLSVSLYLSSIYLSIYIYIFWCIYVFDCENTKN